MPAYDSPRIITGLADVLASGTVIAFDQHSISLSLPLDQTSRLKITFAFRDDPARAGPRTEFGPESAHGFAFRDDSSPGDPRTEVGPGSPHGITLSLVNFNDPEGSGNKEPLKLGTLRGQSLYLSFRVYALKDSPKTLHYTVYLRDDERANKIQFEAIRNALARMASKVPRP